MPWTLIIARANGEPLGAVDHVRAVIEQRLPGTRFWRDPSGAERLAAMDRRGVAIPPELGQILGDLPADERGLYDSGGISLEFFLGTDPTVKSLTIDVRGGGNPIPALRLLCESDGWQVRELSGAAVDLGAADAEAGWTRFIHYRDKGIEEIKRRDTNP
jgi:hypothetical protein